MRMWFVLVRATDGVRVADGSKYYDCFERKLRGAFGFCLSGLVVEV